MTSFSTLFGPLGETFAAGPLPATNLIWCDQKIQIKTLLFRASFGKNARRNAQQRTIVATGARNTQKQTVFACPIFRKSPARAKPNTRTSDKEGGFTDPHMRAFSKRQITDK